MYIYRPMIAFLISQLLKIVIETIRNRKFDFRRVVSMGGMPSTHASGTTALTASLWRDFGFDAPVTAIALIFTMIVLYDAAGIRRATGKQAVVLNKILEELMRDRQLKEERLKELLGHTPFQVLMGILVGLLVGLCL